jgi:mRNA interferase RelE/StbE
VKTIIFSHAAAKELDALPLEARVAVENGLIQYAATGEGDVKRVVGQAGYRLRIGRYRVLFAEDACTILAVYIGKRETTTYR